MVLVIMFLFTCFGAYTWIGRKNVVVKISSIAAIVTITGINIYYGISILNNYLLINAFFGMLILTSILYDHLPEHWKDVNNI